MWLDGCVLIPWQREHEEQQRRRRRVALVVGGVAIGAGVAAGLGLLRRSRQGGGAQARSARVAAGRRRLGGVTSLGSELTHGPSVAIGDLEAGTGDAAGVFTLWVGDDLVYYGRASHSNEAKPSNRKQADGVRGRVRVVARQPGAPLQRRLAACAPELWASVAEDSDRKRASRILLDHGTVRFDSGDEAEEALASIRDELDEMLGG